MFFDIKKISRAVMFACVVAVALSASPSLAQYGEQKKDQKQEQKTRKTPAMSERTYKKLSEAREFAEADNLAEAVKTLDELRSMRNLNSYELAQMWNFYGFIYFSQERYDDAIRAYEQVIAQPDLPLALDSGTKYALAQLYFAKEDYPGAERALRRWFAVAEDPRPQPYILLAQAMYQQSKYREALVPIERAMTIAEEDNRPVKENWLLLQRVLYFELGDYPKVAEVLHRLILLNSKKEYWTQLSGIYGELNMTDKQLICYEVAYLGGMLTRGRELVTLAQLYLQSEIPYKAARILEPAIKDGTVDGNERNYRLLAQAWMLAQDDRRAIPALQQTARLSDDGEMDVRLARAFINLDRWGDAVDALRAGIRKRGIRRPDQASILLGMALYNLERYGQARTAFRAAQKDNRSRRVASQWIQHVGNEEKRQRQLAEALEN